MDLPWVWHDCYRTSDEDVGDGASGQQFQSFGAGEAKRRPCARDGWDLCMAETSKLFWLLVLGTRDSGRAGELDLPRWVCGCAVEVFQWQDRK